MYYCMREVHAECIVCDKQLISDTALEKMIATDYAHRLTMDKDRKGEKKMINFDAKATEIVRDYIVDHLDKSDPMPDFQVFTVWKCKTLQNWKYLLSSTLFDGMYYELTYNGDKHEWYLDAYKKFENRVVKEEND